VPVNEQEWLKSIEIDRMLECLVSRKYPDAEPCNWGNGDRKKRLFILACVSRIWNSLPAEYKAVFEMLDPNSTATDEVRRAAWNAAESVPNAKNGLLFAVGYDDIGLISYYVSKGDEVEAGNRRAEVRRQSELQHLASLLRDIFGNPFRPVALDPRWLTSTVLNLSHAIYDERTFDKMPILADALMDAGCDSEEMLAHCRGPGPHVRSCWVVDLLLGKE
jgi:hypothetical protein